MIDLSLISNPILRLKDNLRDPSVFKGPNAYTLFYTRYEVGEWNLACNWSVACCTTRDSSERAAAVASPSSLSTV